MVGIHEIGGLTGATNTKPVEPRNKKADTVKTDNSQDAVIFSTEAKEASDVARLVAQAKAEDTVRAEKIQESRKKMEEGTYKVLEVVEQVAARLSKYVA